MMFSCDQYWSLNTIISVSSHRPFSCYTIVANVEDNILSNCNPNLTRSAPTFYWLISIGSVVILAIGSPFVYQPLWFMQDYYSRSVAKTSRFLILHCFLTLLYRIWLLTIKINEYHFHNFRISDRDRQSKSEGQKCIGKWHLKGNDAPINTRPCGKYMTFTCSISGICFEINFSNWQEDLTVYCITCDHWWRLKTVGMKCYRGWACVKIDVKNVWLVTPHRPGRSALQLKARQPEWFDNQSGLVEWLHAQLGWD